MDNHKRIPLWTKIAIHLLLVFMLALLTVSYMKKGGDISSSDYITGIGSVASLYGIIIALYQIIQAKSAAEAAEIAAKQKIKEISHFMSFANISRHIEMSNSIPAFLSAQQYEAAIIKIDQLKELLVEIVEYEGLSDVERRIASSHITKLGTDIISLRKQMNGQNNLEQETVVTHIINTNTFLQAIYAKLKK